MISFGPMMTRRGLSRFDCCPGHNPRSYDHGRERAVEKREWRRDPDTTIPNRFQPGRPAAASRKATPTRVTDRISQ
ncbi:hypothetical protein OG749_45875 (plasmid) [Streptomyces nojiriensis]|uniref:hypothetical protein n=1 Tax=Streptomyces nojiriensis TaxID=66374 RepID=UPI002E181295